MSNYKVKKALPLIAYGVANVFVENEEIEETKLNTYGFCGANIEYLIKHGFIEPCKPVRYEYVGFRKPEPNEWFVSGAFTGKIMQAEADSQIQNRVILKPLTAYTEEEIREAFKWLCRNDTEQDLIPKIVNKLIDNLKEAKSK